MDRLDPLNGPQVKNLCSVPYKLCEGKLSLEGLKMWACVKYLRN